MMIPERNENNRTRITGMRADGEVVKGREEVKKRFGQASEVRSEEVGRAARPRYRRLPNIVQYQRWLDAFPAAVEVLQTVTRLPATGEAPVYRPPSHPSGW